MSIVGIYGCSSYPAYLSHSSLQFAAVLLHTLAQVHYEEYLAKCSTKAYSQRPRPPVARGSSEPHYHLTPLLSPFLHTWIPAALPDLTRNCAKPKWPDTWEQLILSDHGALPTPSGHHNRGSTHRFARTCHTTACLSLLYSCTRWHRVATPQFACSLLVQSCWCSFLFYGGCDLAGCCATTVGKYYLRAIT